MNSYKEEGLQEGLQKGLQQGLYQQAIQSAKTIQPHILYPYHYGDTNINEVKDGLKNEKEIEVRIRALQ